MAIQNNYDGPPSLKVYQDFVRTSSSGSVDQNAVIVAQHYDVYKPENAVDADYHAYSLDKESTHALKWLDVYGSGDIKAKYENVDRSSVKLYFRNTYLSQATKEATIGETKNVIKLGEDIRTRGFTPELINVGDMVLADGIVAKIISIENGAQEASYNTTSGSFKTAGSFVGSKDMTYYLKVTKVTTGEGDVVTSADVEISSMDSSYTEVVVMTSTSNAKVGDSGLTISVKDITKVTVGASATITAVARKELRNVIRLNRALDKVSGAAVTVEFGKARDFIVHYPDMTNEGIYLTSVAPEVYFGGTLKADAKVICGEVFVAFRSINTKFNGKLGFIDETNLDEIGLNCIENPAGAMVNAALKGGLGVYVTTVSADTFEQYRKAFILLAKSTNTYGLVIGTTNKEIIAEAASFVEQMADPDTANYKILYYGLDANEYGVIMSDLKDYDNAGNVIGSHKVSGSIIDGVLTIADGIDGFITEGVMSGDRVGMNGKFYTVDTVLTNNTVKLTDITVNVPNTYEFTVTRRFEGQALVDELKSRVYTNSHRCYCVFGDGITVDGIADAPAWLLAALPAGMRAGEYCQRPISNLAYSGATADNKLSLSPAELRDLASRGVWILANTADGSQVYNYHQLSTDMSDKKLQEQSYTTNFDNISRGARALMLPYYGNSNISEEFLNQLYANLSAYLSSKQVNAPSIEVGPQLIRYSNLTITQDKVNKDRVYMEVDYEMPAPFNHIVLRQRLI